MKKNTVAVAVFSAVLLTACGSDSADTLPVYLISEINTVAVSESDVETPHARTAFEYANDRVSKVTVYGPPETDLITGLDVEPIIYYSKCSYSPRSETSGFRDRNLEMRNKRIGADGAVASSFTPNCSRGSNNNDGKIIEKIYLGPTAAQLAAAADAEGDLVETLTLVLIKDTASSRASGSKLTIQLADGSAPAVRHNHYITDENGGLRGIVLDEVVSPAIGSPSVQQVAYNYAFYGNGLMNLRDRIDRPDPSVTDPSATLGEKWLTAKTTKDYVESGLAYIYPNSNSMRIESYRTLGARQIGCQIYKAENNLTKTVTTMTAPLNDNWCAEGAARLVDTYSYITK